MESRIAPIILATVLPFGINKEGTMFRFSLCIDPKSNYEPGDHPDVRAGRRPRRDDEEVLPDFHQLRDFMFVYGDTIHGKIKDNLYVRIGSTRLKGVPVFKVFDQVATHWKSVLPADTFKPGDKELPIGKMSINPLNNHGLEAFFNELPQPLHFREAAISGYEKVIAQNGIDAKAFLSEVKQRLDVAAMGLTDLNKKLKGIYEYAAAQDPINNILPSARHTHICESTESILSTFSFIQSNTLLQRVFGTTIDFELPVKEVLEALGNNRSFQVSIDEKTFDAFHKSSTWNYLKAPMRLIEIESRRIIILEQTQKFSTPTFTPTNYDLAGKLKSLEPMLDKVAEMEYQLDAVGVDEGDSGRYIKEALLIDGAPLTRGINIYQDNLAALLNQEKEFLHAKVPADVITLNDVIKGYRFGIIKDDPNMVIRSLGRRRVHMENLNLPEEFLIQDFSVSADTAMHATIVETDDRNVPTGQVNNRMIFESGILTWSGENIGMPSVFSNPEDETNNEPRDNEGSISDAARIVGEQFSKVFSEEYFPIGVRYTSPHLGGTSKLNLDNNKPLTIQYSFERNQKLLLGNTYEIVSTPEYKNGYAIPFEATANSAGLLDIKDPFHFQRVPSFLFKRNEPVKPIAFYAGNRLFDTSDELKPTAYKDREGESLHHLVIRNFVADLNVQVITNQETVRYILPPSISFEHAFWHNKIFEMDPKDSYSWYKKYQFPASPDKGDEDYQIENSIRMRDWYGKHCTINYLPDPLVRGFRFEFYRDKDYKTKANEYEPFEKNEYYFKGAYPKIRSWRMVIQTVENGRPLLSVDDEEIIIRVDKGVVLYVIARTILDKSYEQQLEAFGNYNEFTRMGNNELLTPVLKFSIVHATQRPSIIPRIRQTMVVHKEMEDTTVFITNAVHIEQLGLFKDSKGVPKYLPCVQPTGNLEFYAKWEEYKDDPAHLISEKDKWDPTMPVNKIDLNQFEAGGPDRSPAVFQAAVNFSEEQMQSMQQALFQVDETRNEMWNYATHVRIDYDNRETKFQEKWFWVQNKSRFGAYYPQEAEPNESPLLEKQNIRTFPQGALNRISRKPFLVRILNNRKPTIPLLHQRNMNLLVVQEDLAVGPQLTRTQSMNRLRLYFQRGRLTSGKGERIGFVLNEAGSPYNEYFKKQGWISTVGRDIVSDSVKPFDALYKDGSVLLQRSHFVINDPPGLKDQDGINNDDLESFQPKYVASLGLMTYLPKFDKKLDLWYLDVELDINEKEGKELHNPFLQFTLVHYQENSFNYNEPTGVQDVTKDCRISEIYKPGFIYIMGSRTISVTKENRSVNVKLLADPTSLKEGMTKFYAFIQQSVDGIKWEEASDPGTRAMAVIPANSATGIAITYNNSQAYKRLLLLETEEWQAPSNNSLEELLEQKNNRVVLISLFDL